MPGILYVAATPIGNLGDLSLRAVETLRSADLILCEDTRTSGVLLRHYAVTAAVKSLHRHNEAARCRPLIRKLQNGSTVVMLADAGTPLVSDAGKMLVTAAHRAGISVSPLPGACAVPAALSCSGFDGDRFVFEGFLPSRRGERLARLRALCAEDRTLVFFEAPHRLLHSLHDMQQVFGTGRKICLAKELTKIHETVVHGTIAEIIAWLGEDDARRKGEFVLLLNAAQSAQDNRITTTADELLHLLSAHLPPATAAGIVARLGKIPRRELYRRTQSPRK